MLIRMASSYQVVPCLPEVKFIFLRNVTFPIQMCHLFQASLTKPELKGGAISSWPSFLLTLATT